MGNNYGKHVCLHRENSGYKTEGFFIRKGVMDYSGPLSHIKDGRSKQIRDYINSIDLRE